MKDQTITVLDALVEALRAAGRYDRNDQVAPAAVLWPDRERQWESLLPRLRARLPILTLGPYDPATWTGPAYWIRCVLARRLPEIDLPDDVTPIIYLPSYSRQDIRASEDCPRPLQTLAELQYRGVLWTQKSGRDWTIAAFLQSRDGGLGIEVGADSATREAMRRALDVLASEPVEHLRREAPLRAAFFNALLAPDDVRDLLLWLDDPEGYPKRVASEAWAAFCDLARERYGFDPERDGPIHAARLLGLRQGEWGRVWQRFAEAPQNYPRVPDRLRAARPLQVSLLESPSLFWPQDNEAAEEEVRLLLAALADRHPDEARAAIRELDALHGPRRDSVWTRLGQAPLAQALAHLVTLAEATERTLGGTTVAEIASAYAEWGWRADDAALAALSAVTAGPDLDAVKLAVAAIYRPWLKTGAETFQRSVAQGQGTAAYPWRPLEPVEQGTCILFSDALRFDLAMRLAQALERSGCVVHTGWRLAALPPVTPTAKPAVTPVAHRLGPGPGLGPEVRSTGTPLSSELLRRVLGEAGFQVLLGDETGDPASRAWTELGAIDRYGHDHGWRVAQHAAGELARLAERVRALLDAGWARVVVLTDHGWLLLPGGLPKVELSTHLAEVRKGRCARLKATVQTEYQTVPWHWDPGVYFAMAPGIACFEAGKEYEHGGLSPQECVVPILTVTRRAGGKPVRIEAVSWHRLRCTVVIAGGGEGMVIDIRSRPGDPSTSLVERPKEASEGQVALFVLDPDREGETATIVVVGPEGTILAQRETTIGG
jgi:hypothetical protein